MYRMGKKPETKTSHYDVTRQGPNTITVRTRTNCVDGKWIDPNTGLRTATFADVVSKFGEQIGRQTHELPQKAEFIPDKGHSASDHGVPGRLKIEFRKTK